MAGPSWDTNIGSHNGRVLEILSEHTCQGWMQGYALTGRYVLFPSYEAFLGIIATMVDQYAKFIKMSKDFPWRLPGPFAQLHCHLHALEAGA